MEWKWWNVDEKKWKMKNENRYRWIQHEDPSVNNNHTKKKCIYDDKNNRDQNKCQ